MHRGRAVRVNSEERQNQGFKWVNITYSTQTQREGEGGGKREEKMKKFKTKINNIYLLEKQVLLVNGIERGG